MSFLWQKSLSYGKIISRGQIFPPWMFQVCFPSLKKTFLITLYFRCQYCNTQLRLGSYAFDRDGLYDNKFFCIHHFGMVGEPPVTKVIRKPSHRQPGQSPEKKPELTGLDLLDRGL